MTDLLKDCKSCGIELDGKYEQRLGYCISCQHQYDDEDECRYNEEEEE